MQPELAAIVDFLADIKPFNVLEQTDLHWAAEQIEISYHRKGSDETILDLENPSLFIVRAGAFDVNNSEGELLDRVVEGGFFGFVSLLTGSSGGNTVKVHEDGLLYQIDKKAFKRLRERCDEIDQFFNNAFEQRLRVGLRARADNQALAARIGDIMTPKFESVGMNASIEETAKRMAELNIASIGVTDQDGKLGGIFTDKDCRARVIAKGVSYAEPINQVMTKDPITVDENQFVHEANYLMARYQIKHLPVTTQNGEVAGMVTLSDLIRLQRSDPVLIIGEIHRAKTVEGVIDASHKIPDLLRQMIKMDLRADDLGRILTSVTGALTRQLIDLAQQQLGPEPIPFVWLAFGSQGRQDQSAKSDQDNGLLLSNDYQPEHAPYFAALAKIVNDGLDACGYVYCPGDVMASNPQWCQPLAGWQSAFSNWITQPSTKALMHASIFFDLRPIHHSDGAEGLFDALQTNILQHAAENTIFLQMMTSNALDLTPPIGFFKQLVIDHSGEHRNTFDVKLRGMMPITDIARIHSLANGVTAVNTRERIKALAEIKALSPHDAENLLDAHEYIAHQRLLHQGEQLSRGEDADNHLNPEQFSALTIRHLKDAFKVVRDAQQGLKMRYGHGLL